MCKIQRFEFDCNLVLQLYSSTAVHSTAVLGSDAKSNNTDNAGGFKFKSSIQLCTQLYILRSYSCICLLITAVWLRNEKDHTSDTAVAYYLWPNHMGTSVAAEHASCSFARVSLL